MRRDALGALCLLAGAAGIGCGAPSAAGSRVASAADAKGSTLEDPVLRCGPTESYRYVASEFACPGGGNPFGGDLDAARQARVGAEQNPSTGHFVDSYAVPCERGKITLYVDMYGCEEMQQLEQQVSGKPGPGVERLVGLYDTGSYAGVMSQCASVMMTGKPMDEWVWCGYLQPASMVMMGEPREATEFVGKLCSGMPPAGPASAARADTVASVVVWVARGSATAGRDVGRREAELLLLALSRACGVEPEDVVRRLQVLTGEQI
jgi:hypothetical protein